jgi:hypothetical protein
MIKVETHCFRGKIRSEIYIAVICNPTSENGLSGLFLASFLFDWHDDITRRIKITVTILFIADKIIQYIEDIPQSYNE